MAVAEPAERRGGPAGRPVHGAGQAVGRARRRRVRRGVADGGMGTQPRGIGDRAGQQGAGRELPGRAAGLPTDRTSSGRRTASAPTRSTRTSADATASPAPAPRWPGTDWASSSTSSPTTSHPTIRGRARTRSSSSGAPARISRAIRDPSSRSTARCWPGVGNRTSRPGRTSCSSTRSPPPCARPSSPPSATSPNSATECGATWRC